MEIEYYVLNLFILNVYIAISIIDCIGKFSDLTPFDSNQKKIFKNWLLDICVNNNIEDSSVAKAIIIHLFKLSDNDIEQELVMIYIVYVYIYKININKFTNI